VPGGRSSSASWADAIGDLWLYGGASQSGQAVSNYGDLWRYNIAGNQWTWISGSDVPNVPSSRAALGVAAVGNTPGARLESGYWFSGGTLWLFGGYGFDPNTGGQLNDLWKFVQ